MTRLPGLEDLADASLVSMTEAELAQSTPLPHKIVKHRGRYWRESWHGLYEPIHRLGRRTAEEASCPARLCWGYHTTLVDDASDRANATEPFHVLQDLESFGPHSISSNRRYQLHRSRRCVEFVRIATMEALEQEAYEVFRSGLDRTQDPYREPRTREALLKQLSWYVGRPSAIIVAGLVDGELGGFISGCVIDGTAYVSYVDVSTKALRTHISIGLHFAFIEVCQRSDGVREIVHSAHIPEDRALSTFKTSIGFPIVHVPSRLVMPPLALTLLRRRRPFFYYRVSGQATGPVLAVLE